MSKSLALIRAFAKQRIGVLGDVMLDIFDYGRVERESPEAPVPIVNVYERRMMPGGAGNVAVNARMLAAVVDLVGTIGDDPAGATLTKLLWDAGIELSLVTAEDRPTTEKHRVLKDGTHILRVDHENNRPVGEDCEREIIAHLERCMPRWDALIISDYAKGVVTERVATRALALAREHGVPIVVDTKPAHAKFFSRLALVTPNVKEALAMSGASDVATAGPLLEKLFASPVLITEGKDGMTLFAKGKTVHIPAYARSVVDVSGAGDTVTTAAALVLSAEGSLEDAIEIAAVAAAAAVEKPGTGAVTADELMGRL